MPNLQNLEITWLDIDHNESILRWYIRFDIDYSWESYPNYSEHPQWQ